MTTLLDDYLEEQRFWKADSQVNQVLDDGKLMFPIRSAKDREFDRFMMKLLKEYKDKE